MKLKFCILLMLAGCILNSEAGFYNPRRYYHNFEAQDEETARELNARLEWSIEDEWTRNTKADADPPTISNAASFNDSDIFGKTMVTFHNRTIYAFQGFRYGLAERFQPPVPVDVFWDVEDSFNATHIGFKCPQGAVVGSDPAGNEDCLFLNVYTPYLPSEGKGLLPVMQFIHGGSFTSGDSSYYMPTRLLDHEVILVTIHYRLGAFGFWTMSSEEAPGNLALYDILESLRWTQRHIQDFGGDPEKVTVFGESAGSAAASYMLVLPAAKDLHRAVIADSGSCFDHWTLDEDPSYATTFLANEVGCNPDDPPDDLLACMQSVPFEDLVHAEGQITSEDRHMGLMGFRGASPTLQTFSLSEDATYELILEKRPREYFQHRENNNVAFMTGANRQEGSFVVGILYGDFILPNHLENNATYLREQSIQDLLRSIGVSDDTHAIATSMQRVFCPDIDLANFTEAIPCVIDLTGVLYLKAGSWEVANYHSYYTDKPTYYYSFEFESDDSLFHFTGLPFDGGITHADDLLYLFSMPAIMDNGTQLRNMDRMTLMWTNFAIYLDPTPVNETEAIDELELPIWTPYIFENHSFLVIAEDCTNEKEFSDRWTITVDELRVEPSTTTTTQDPEACVGECVDYKDQRDTYEAVMITFIVLFVVGLLVAIYFIFKARR